MYEVRTKSSKVNKDFDNLIDSLSLKNQKKIINILHKNPLVRPSGGDSLCKVEKKGKFWCIEATGGDRILYHVNKKTKIVFIHYAGNHDGEIRYLKKYAKS